MNEQKDISLVDTRDVTKEERLFRDGSRSPGRERRKQRLIGRNLLPRQVFARKEAEQMYSAPGARPSTEASVQQRSSRTGSIVILPPASIVSLGSVPFVSLAIAWRIPQPVFKHRKELLALFLFQH
jgi:hypothetical protein